jgi:major outer membrane protein
MKKLMVTMLTILTCGALQALSVGNPGEASLFTNGIYFESNDCNNCCDPCFSWCDAWSLRIGFQGNYVYNRHLEVDSDDITGREIERTSLFTNAGYLALNICDRVDFFATLGSTTIELDLDSRIITPATPTIVLSTLRFEPQFSWSVGGRATLWECNCFMIGLEGEYFRTSPRFDYYKGNSSILVSLDDNFSSTYREWQVGLGASYIIATSCPKVAFVPYLAITWSGAKFTASDLLVSADPTLVDRFPGLENSKLWGYAVGTSLTLCDVAGVAVEGRFGSEKALYVNGQFRF